MCERAVVAKPPVAGTEPVARQTTGSGRAAESIAAIKNKGPANEPLFDINDLITDIANANSTLGFYLAPPGRKKC
jgi:hypothetical protein